MRDGKEFMPRGGALKDVRLSWERAWQLPDAELVDKKELLSTLRSDLIAYLEKKVATTDI